MPDSPRSSNPLGATSDFLRALRGFLNAPLDLSECQRQIQEQYRTRDRSFLRLLRDAVYADARNPYARLLAHAGIAYDDVCAMVRTDGLDDTLSRLHLAGVRLTVDEFKGRRTIRRGSLEIETRATDFDNTTLSQHFQVRPGGSRGLGRTLLVDLELLTHEASYDVCAAAEFGLFGRRRAIWRPVPPGSAGLKSLLRYAKVRLPADRWFSQNPVWSVPEWRHTLFTAGALTVGRLAGHQLARPEHVPVGRADVVARWLSDAKAQGTAAVLNTNAASAVRVCHAAEALGLDISDSFFRVGGEPYTAGKAGVFAHAGCRVVTNYAMSEVGRIANSCGNPDALDDVHVATDKFAIVARDVVPPGGALPVAGLFLTTLHESTSRVMINVELGDYGTLSRRSCGCLLDRLGQTLHLRDIRSYEKLTAEGMHFVGSDLLDLIEEILPRQFGGRLMDYQMVEEEQNGTPTVTLVVSPRVGTIDEGRLKSVVIDRLGSTTPPPG